MWRPLSTHWFEVLCPRDESVRILAELARTGAIELESRLWRSLDLPLAHLSARLGDYEALYPRYGRYWERGIWRQAALAESPEAVLDRALARIAAWRQEADPLIDVLQACEEESTRLKWLAQVIERLADSALDFAAFAHVGPFLGGFCAVLPLEAQLPLPQAIIDGAAKLSA